MKYKFIAYHSKLNPTFGTTWHGEAENLEEANKQADKICLRLQHGAKPSKRFGIITHTPCEKE